MGSHETQRFLYDKGRGHLNKLAGYRTGKDLYQLHIQRGLISKILKIKKKLCGPISLHARLYNKQDGMQMGPNQGPAEEAPLSRPLAVPYSYNQGAGRTAQQLTACTVLAGPPSLFPSTLQVTIASNSNSKGSNALLWPSWAPTLMCTNLHSEPHRYM